MEKKKRNNATITFSDKSQKEQLLGHLNSVQLQNLMPDSVKGKDCQKVLWAVEYLHRLAVDGKIRVEVPMFEADSQEKQGLLEEIARLKAENETLKKQLQTDEKPDDSGDFEVSADYEPDLMAIAMMQPMKHQTRIKRVILRQ